MSGIAAGASLSPIYRGDNDIPILSSSRAIHHQQIADADPGLNHRVAGGFDEIC